MPCFRKLLALIPSVAILSIHHYPAASAASMRNMNAPKLPVLFLALAASVNFPIPLGAQTPEWIWHDNKGAAPADGEVRYFRKTFTIDGPASKAVLSAAGDDHVIVFLNGKEVLRNDTWQQAYTVDVTRALE